MLYIFNQEQWLILIRLVLAHILSDFIFQPASWVRDKHNKKYKSSRLYIHGLASGIFAYLLIPGWGLHTIVLALALAVVHTLIDVWKLTKDKEGEMKFFILDQILHLVTLVLLWLTFINGWQSAVDFWLELMRNNNVLLVITGYLLCVWPAGYAIDLLLKQMNLPGEAKTAETQGFKRAGIKIGIFERIIILTLVLLGQYTAIGFLITGKSLLRWGERENGISEYVLVGTMLSYAIAIIIGVLINLCI